MFRIVAVFAVVVVLPASAQAHFGSGEGQARQIAAEKFPGACDPTITKHIPMPGLAYTAQRGCRIRLAEGWHDHSFSERCSALVHEYGHLAGFPHSDNPASVMFESLNIFSPCEQNLLASPPRA
jgi:hypothetical protein